MHGRGSYAIPAPQLSPDHQQLEISSVCSLGLPGARGFLPRYSRQKVYVPTQALRVTVKANPKGLVLGFRPSKEKIPGVHRGFTTFPQASHTRPALKGLLPLSFSLVFLRSDKCPGISSSVFIG